MSTTDNLIPDVLRCLLQIDTETGRWNGHCLDLDLATSGKDAEEAWKNLRAVVRLHVEHSFTNWQQGLKFRANDDEIAVFEALKAKQRVRSEKITFNLVPPKDHGQGVSPLWIEAVEDREGVMNASACFALQ
jgi:predicted RNase H-like HicB family nuclease